MGDLDPLLTQVFLGPHKPASQMAQRSVQPFCADTHRLCYTCDMCKKAASTGNRVMIVLRRALGLPVGGAIQTTLSVVTVTVTACGRCGPTNIKHRTTPSHCDKLTANNSYCKLALSLMGLYRYSSIAPSLFHSRLKPSFSANRSLCSILLLQD